LIRGIIFDLDGTLVDSRLDFELIRQEMGLAPGLPIPETMETLASDHAERCRKILHRHELAGCERATLLPGVAQLLEIVAGRGLKRAIATRNSRMIAEATLARHGLAMDLVMTRDDGPMKPDPWPVLHACRQWAVDPRETVVVGDYRFDIESGRSAGAWTVLLTHDGNPAAYPNEERADLVLSSLSQYQELLAWLNSLPT
jgi:HAD superfamily hydrolase (TIGR01509 family)